MRSGVCFEPRPRRTRNSSTDSNSYGLPSWPAILKAYGDLFELWRRCSTKGNRRRDASPRSYDCWTKCSSTFGTRPLSLTFFVRAHHQWGRCRLRSVRLWTARTATGRCLSSSVSKRSSIRSTTLGSLNRQLSIAWKARWRLLTNAVLALGN
jgi:hypothetical protein